MTRSQWIQTWVTISICMCINIVLALLPNLIWYVWAIQLLYLAPASLVFVLLRRDYIIAAMWIAGGATLVLDIALCGIHARG